MNRDYSNANFHELRVYARSIGVKSPTSYSKAALIRKIIEVENGLTKPERTTRGRPSNQKLIPVATPVVEKRKIAHSRKEILFEIKETIKLLESVFDKISKLDD